MPELVPARRSVAWRIAVLAVGLVLTTRAGRAAAGSDDWLGADKALHASLSAGLAMAGYGTAAQAWPRAGVGPRLWLGGGVALGAGLAKEGWDRAGHGDASLKDLTWDAVGTASGLAIAWAINRIFF